jgi:hypothetical protein
MAGRPPGTEVRYFPATRSKMKPLTIPDLPEYEPDKSIRLPAVCDILARPGENLNPEQIQRWITRGVYLIRGGPRYKFPAYREGKYWRTTPAWIAAWLEFGRRVKVEDARRMMSI